MSKLTDIISLTHQDAERLAREGVYTIKHLLLAGSTSAGRMWLADRSGLDDHVVKRWVHQADLLRIAGMTPLCAECLCKNGVLTVPKLAYRAAAAVYELCACETNLRITYSEIAAFIAEAKKLPKIVHH